MIDAIEENSSDTGELTTDCNPVQVVAL